MEPHTQKEIPLFSVTLYEYENKAENLVWLSHFLAWLLLNTKLH